MVTSARRKAFTRAGYVLDRDDQRMEGSEMKGKAVRIVLVLAVLGALAAIPASTQGLLGKSQSSSDEAGVDLPMVLLVNRLELSRQQMETLRLTIDGLLNQVAVLDQKRALFEQEMIAFSGTAKELDVRLAAFRAETKTARTVLGQEMAAAVATLKDTLTMKQGEVLRGAFPGIVGRWDAVSTDSMGRAPQAQAGAMQIVAARPSARMTMRGGQATMMSPSTQIVPEPIQGSAGVAGKIQAMVERVRERVADRMTSAATAVLPAGATCPMAGTMRMSPQGRDSFSGQAESVVPSASAACPMVGTIERFQVGGSASGRVDVLMDGVEGSDEFGAVTISLSDDGSLAPVEVEDRGGEQRSVSWLLRLVRVLELKLAAMK
jgi:hypothetical protein